MSVAKMQAIDAAAIDSLGIPRLVLMEHAGLAVARAAVARLHEASRLVLVCCGTGYNGGDGLCAARHLCGWGYPVRVLVAGQPERLREEPATYAQILRRLGVPLVGVDRPEALDQAGGWVRDPGVIVDALLGIGLRDRVREPITTLIARINASGRPVISADVPSGLDADTGAVRGAAVKATVTVAFGLAKRGCLTGEGPAHVGELIVDSITMPQRLLSA